MTIVIVGSGLAGIIAAMMIRQLGSQSPVAIYSDEKYFYYPRPKLYDVLSGEIPPEKIIAFPEQWYEKRNIQLYVNKKVLKIDATNRAVVLEDGSKVTYEKLLLTNGAHPFVPPIQGIEKTGVFSLRSLEDAITIRDFARKVENVTVVGGGLLGLEFAFALKKLQLQVNVVEIFPWLLPMQLDQEGAAIFQNQIETQGIKVVLGVKTVEVLGNESVSGLLLDNGKTLSSNLVLFSTGIRPNIVLAQDSGIKVNKGVLVNQYMQTSATDVYAAGDIAEFEGKIYGIIPAAEEQARIAGNNMVGEGTTVYKGTVPSNTLKVLGIDLTSMGIINPEGTKFEVIKKILPEKGIYKKIVLEQGKIVGTIILGETKSVGTIKRLMEMRADTSKYTDSLLEDDFNVNQTIL
ncbi:MAG: FAD-dependent oxidoreductase [Candidatus Bathyarchaeota archaeon]